MRGAKGGALVVQVFKVERGGAVGTLRVRDDARPLFDYEVESLLRQLRMPPAEARTHFAVDLEPAAATVRGRGRIV